MLTILVESPHFDLVHDASCSCLYATWYSYDEASARQATYELILQQVRATQSTKLLNDGLLDEHGWGQLLHWLAKDHFRQLAQVGLQVVAWVLPRNSQAFYDTFQVLKRLQRPLVDTFSEAEAAYHWLHC